MRFRRLQAPLGSLLAAVMPRARLVPAVKPEDMSPDPAVVCANPAHHSEHTVASNCAVTFMQNVIEYFVPIEDVLLSYM